MRQGQQNREMFNSIAPRYDLLNHLLSLNIDKRWRRVTVRQIASTNPANILDIATGTADLAILIAQSISSATVAGIDMAENMLCIGQEKVERLDISDRVKLHHGDALALPFDDASFDAVCCAFGVRNFSDIKTGLDEMHRVLAPKGQVTILEFSMPDKQPFKQVYKLYFNNLLPLLGGIISGNNGAYKYLPNSVAAFPSPDKFITMMNDSGFSTVTKKSLSMGIATLFTGKKE